MSQINIIDGGKRSWDPPPNSDALAINREPLLYWGATGYTSTSCFDLCSGIDQQAMAAMISFSGDGAISVRITKKTWERQAGHYQTMQSIFGSLVAHPMLKPLKGDLIVWLEDGMWAAHKELSKTAPVLAFGREISDTHTIIIPDPAYLGSSGYTEDLQHSAIVSMQHPWEERSPIVYWRGAATGLGIEGDDWKKTARGQLTLLSNRIANRKILDAKLTRLKHLPMEQIDTMLREGVVDDEVPFDTFFKYRYMVDADGYSCAWRSLYLKLALGSIVLKVKSPFEQWYHRRLIPWHHYIPLESDLSDFNSAYEWLRNNDEKAREIVQAGERFIRGITLEQTLDELAYYCSELLLCQMAT